LVLGLISSVGTIMQMGCIWLYIRRWRRAGRRRKRLTRLRERAQWEAHLEWKKWQQRQQRNEIFELPRLDRGYMERIESGERTATIRRATTRFSSRNVRPPLVSLSLLSDLEKREDRQRRNHGSGSDNDADTGPISIVEDAATAAAGHTSNSTIARPKTLPGLIPCWGPDDATASGNEKMDGGARFLRYGGELTAFATVRRQRRSSIGSINSATSRCQNADPTPPPPPPLIHWSKEVVAGLDIPLPPPPPPPSSQQRQSENSSKERPSRDAAALPIVGADDEGGDELELYNELREAIRIGEERQEENKKDQLHQELMNWFRDRKKQPKQEE
jgi:hypothetical protein